MAGPKVWSEELIAERIKNGRGQGSYRSYQPWMYVQEFSSRGTQTRIPGVKVARTVHTFSYLERALFLLAEFQRGFVDFREQFPMDRAVTLGAAKTLGIKHPVYPKTRNPVVMTMDAVVTMSGKGGEQSVAGWDVKPARMLEKARVLEKLSIHKAYCAHAGIPHYVFTEQSYSRQMVRNIDWIRMAIPKDRGSDTVDDMFSKHPAQMLERLSSCKKAPVLTEFCAQYDAAHALPRGTGLSIMKQLLWDHSAVTDLSADRIELARVRVADPGSPMDLGGCFV